MPNVIPAEARHLTGPHVVVLAYDGLCLFEFSLAYEVFGLPRPELGKGWYRYSVAALEAGSLRAAGGLQLEVPHDPELFTRADLIIIPGWRSVESPVPRELTETLMAAHRRGARIASLCSGVFVLAAAGLLDGRRATTHWRYADHLRALFPAIAVSPDVLYVDNGTVLTAAGSAAGLDLCLHIVRKDFGVEAANSVARRLVVPPHRDGGQAQFIQKPVPRAFEGSRLGAVLDFIAANPGGALTIGALATRAGMSARTFQRRFQEATGVPVGRYIIRLRLEVAQSLLETRPDLTLDDIAALSGFGAPDTLRHHFRREKQISPAEWRSRFGRGGGR